MSRISSKNTKPEILFRKYIWNKGIRGYRIHYLISGKPDIAFPKKKVAIFVNGCFWHQHRCKYSILPKSNIKFWNNKINRNKSRDKNVWKTLRSAGWKVFVLWECKLKEKSLNPLFKNLSKIIKK